MNRSAVQYLRIWLFPILVGCLTALIVTGVSIGMFWYARVYRLKFTSTDPAYVFGKRVYAANIIVQSFDSGTGKMLALVDGHMMDEDTRMYLYLSATSTVIQIQDPIIEDGIWTGFKSLGNGTFQDISAGDHAVAMLKANADGSMNVSYLLLGHPSPRP